MERNSTRLATFLKSGVQAVKDTQQSNTPIMLHLADGGDKSAFQWWLDEITNQSVGLILSVFLITHIGTVH